jgi:hypothetical protein
MAQALAKKTSRLARQAVVSNVHWDQPTRQAHRRFAFFRRRVPIFVSLPIVITCAAAGSFLSSLYPSQVTGGAELGRVAGLRQDPLATTPPYGPARREGAIANVRKPEVARQLLPAVDVAIDEAKHTPAISSDDGGMHDAHLNGEDLPSSERRSLPAEQRQPTRWQRLAVNIHRYRAATKRSAGAWATKRGVASSKPENIPLLGPVFSLFQ